MPIAKMNRIFDYNGTIVAPSNPIKKLKTVKKMVSIDSVDRDISKYQYNGDFVVYLPRVYENVVSIRLASADVPAAQPYDILTGNVPAVPEPYFFIDIEGLNKMDECSVGADRSGYPDSYFAKISYDIAATKIQIYNDNSGQENIGYYSPAIGKLDRMHIRTRLHSHKVTGNYIYWEDPSQYSLTFEIEMLDNSFDDFSQFETRVSERA
jgi:hypothetical protein